MMDGFNRCRSLQQITISASVETSEPFCFSKVELLRFTSFRGRRRVFFVYEDDRDIRSNRRRQIHLRIAACRDGASNKLVDGKTLQMS
jgi:hypothetical protein